MYKCIITLIVTNFIVALCAPLVQPNKPMYRQNSKVTNMWNAAALLDPITTSDALPVVLFEIRKLVHKLQPPDDIIRAAIFDKKLVTGTLFHLEHSQRQIFFCPEQNPENPEEKCLVPQEFGSLQPLRCTTAPTPILRVSKKPKDEPQVGDISYSVAYETCDKFIDKKFKSNPEYTKLILFKFRYNHEDRKTLFTSHNLMSPKLLDSWLLFRERNLRYPYDTIGSFRPANYKAIIDALYMEFILRITPPYRIQKLVPTEDMALGTWRKVTFQFINVEFQQSQLFEIWNEMNKKVRQAAIKVSDNERFTITTGVFGNNFGISDRDGQEYNKWIKMIVSKNIHNYDLETSAVVILMNNFLNFETGGDPALEGILNELVELCPHDLCSSEFKSLIQNVSGQMRCCKSNPRLEALFDIKLFPYLPVLKIDGLIETGEGDGKMNENVTGKKRKRKEI